MGVRVSVPSRPKMEIFVVNFPLLTVSALEGRFEPYCGGQVSLEVAGKEGRLDSFLLCNEYRYLTERPTTAFREGIGIQVPCSLKDALEAPSRATEGIFHYSPCLVMGPKLFQCPNWTDFRPEAASWAPWGPTHPRSRNWRRGWGESTPHFLGAKLPNLIRDPEKCTFGDSKPPPPLDIHPTLH
jgi:hypothetical protein